MEVEDRVFNSLLGFGTIKKVFISDKKVHGYLVLFDKTPSIRYNGGSNLCYQLKSDIKLINND